MGKNPCPETEGERELRLGLQIGRALRRVVRNGRSVIIPVKVSSSQPININSNGVLATTYTVESPFFFDDYIAGDIYSIVFENGQSLPSQNLVGSSFLSKGKVFQMGMLNMVSNVGSNFMPEVVIVSEPMMNSALVKLGVLNVIVENVRGVKTYISDIQSFTFYTL